MWVTSCSSNPLLRNEPKGPCPLRDAWRQMTGDAMRTASLILLLAVASNSAVAEWDKVSAGNDGLQTSYVDRGSIKKESHIVTMWSLVDFKNAQKVEESASPKSYKSVAKQFDYDCRQNQYRMTAFNYYLDNLGEGAIVIGDSHLSRSDWEKVAPHSIEEGLWKIACGKN